MRKAYLDTVRQLDQIGRELRLVPEMMETLRVIARHPGDPRGAEAAIAQLALALHTLYVPEKNATAG